MSALFVPAEVEKTLRLFHPTNVYEARCLEATGAEVNGKLIYGTAPTLSGFFDTPESGLDALGKTFRNGATATGIYMLLNGVDRAHLARTNNRLKVAKTGETTADKHVSRLTKLLVDADPIRPDKLKISATDEEKGYAYALILEVKKFLTDLGWPEPVLCDSGNGYHLIFQIDLPPEGAVLIERFLKALAARFDTAQVEIDTSVFNPSRITKLYGTLAAKGDATSDRPHRFSKVLTVPSTWQTVPMELIEALAPEQPPSPPRRAAIAGAFDVDGWVSRYLPHASPPTPYEGGRKWILNPCPFDPAHVGTSSALFQLSGGGLSFTCKHNGCSGRDWKALRGLLDPASHGTGARAGHSQERPEKTQSTPVLVTLSTVEPEEVDWLWGGRIPLAKLTLLEGDPGTGKSTLSLEIAASVTTGGALPDGGRVKASDVVILSAEDGAADTIRPRIDAAGGNASRIHLLTAVNTPGGEETPDLCSHIPAIRAAVEMKKAALVIIDPLMAYLGPDVNSHRDQDIRRTLAPLAKMAEETGAALLVVRHLNKASGGPALYRGGGSIGIAGAARVVLLVAKDPEDDGRRILACVKNNLAPFPPALAFKLVSVGHVARLEWEKDPVSYTADELLAVSFQAPEGQGEKTERKTAKEAAQEWLVQLLWNGPVASKEVDEQIKAAGLSVKTVRNARETLGIIVRRKGYSPDAGWEWRLPEPLRRGRNFETGEILPLSQDAQDVPQDAQEAQALSDGQLGHLGRQEGHLGRVVLEAGGVTSPGFDLEEEAV